MLIICTIRKRLSYNSLSNLIQKTTSRSTITSFFICWTLTGLTSSTNFEEVREISTITYIKEIIKENIISDWIWCIFDFLMPRFYKLIERDRFFLFYKLPHTLIYFKENLILDWIWCIFDFLKPSLLKLIQRERDLFVFFITSYL